MKWWAQSFIVGIPKIVVGYRDNNVNELLLKHVNEFCYPLKCIIKFQGIVSRLETMDVNQLRKQSTVS